MQSPLSDAGSPNRDLRSAASGSIRWLRPSSYFRAILPLIAWAIPVSILVTYNWFTLGHITGYDQTNESIGFSVTEFLTKWDFTVQQLYAYGLFMLLPLGIAGLALMYRRSWRAALFLTLWFLRRSEKPAGSLPIPQRT